MSRINVEVPAVEVKGMQLGEEHTPGDWFQSWLEPGCIELEAPVQGVPVHEQATRVLFSKLATRFGFRVNNIVKQLLGVWWEDAARQNTKAHGFWWCKTGIASCLDEQQDSLVYEYSTNEAGKSISKLLQVFKQNSGMSLREYIQNRCSTGMGPAEFITQITQGGLEVCKILGVKLHPETVKAAEKYPEQYIQAVQAVRRRRDTLECEVRNAAYKGIAGAAYLGTSWGTYYDDYLHTDRTCPRAITHAAYYMFQALYILNLYFCNGKQAPVGWGFQDGTPVLILGKLTQSGKLSTSPIKLGRYLSSISSFTDFRDAIEDLKPLNKEIQTYLCKTEKEWHLGYNSGVKSCMSGFEFRNSPVRIYATTSHGLPDNNLRLLVQYTGELFGADFKVHARAIVHTEKKEYVRAYGNNADGILRNLGYKENSECLDGVMLAKVRNSDGYWLMVYSDGDADEADDMGGYWKLCYVGDVRASTACGYLEDDYDACTDEQPDEEAD